MKILVVDDTEAHRNAAISLLVGHDVTVVSNLFEAEGELMGGGDALFSPPDEDNNPKGYDVVLTDLSMPYDGDLDERYRHLVGTPLPMGIAVASMAIRGNVAKVAVVSTGGFEDGEGSDYHGHPFILWATSHFYEIPGRLKLFNGQSCPMTEIGGVKVKDWKAVLEEMLK